MEKLLMLLKSNELTLEEQRAVSMHNQFIMHKEMAGMGLAGMCMDLHNIKQSKAYEVLGFESFGAYTEQAHGIKERQAYKYIRVYERLGVDVLHSNAKIGVTKLLKLASLDKEERESVLDEYSVEEMDAMNVEEFNRVVEENRKLREQLSFFSDQPQKTVVVEKVDDQAVEKAKEMARKEYDKALAEAKKVAEKEKAAAVEEYKKKAKDLADKLKKANEDKAASDKAVKDLQEKASEREAHEKEYLKLKEQAEKARKEKEELEKKIKTSTDPEMAKFKFLFEAWQGSTSKMMEQREKLSEDQKNKVINAIRKAMEVYGL